MKKLFLVALSFGTYAAIAAITETVENRVVTLSGDGEWTSHYLAEDVDSVNITTTSSITLNPAQASTYTRAGRPSAAICSISKKAMP